MSTEARKQQGLSSDAFVSESMMKIMKKMKNEKKDANHFVLKSTEKFKGLASAERLRTRAEKIAKAQAAVLEAQMQGETLDSKLMEVHEAQKEGIQSQRKVSDMQATMR
eukprot:SAG31_NODE_13371_length_874_cov_1.028387_1_plen_108_part_01